MTGESMLSLYTKADWSDSDGPYGSVVAAMLHLKKLQQHDATTVVAVWITA